MMNCIKILLIGSVMVLAMRSISQSPSKGNLVIVGGGLENNNRSVFNQMIGLSGGTEKAEFAVIPSAGGAPVQSFVYFRSELISYGIRPEKIHLIPIAIMDDDSTEDVNESGWQHNGNDTILANLVRRCSAVWFTGGDQMRTIKTLVMPDGQKTEVLKAVWDVYLSGGVVGGTSAGAAIMSEAMIGGGNSIGALTSGVVTHYNGDDFQESSGVLLTKGLGFFPLGIVDQHFTERARIGRLAVAVMNKKNRFSLGFGIDENTALIYIGGQNLLTVAGSGGVTILDAAHAELTYVRGFPNIENLLVNYLDEGDTYDIQTGQIAPAGDKKPTRGKEYYKVHNPGQAGVLSGYSNSFTDMLTVNLIDNQCSDTIRNLSFYDHNAGFQVTLYKTPLSKGFYCDRPSTGDQYTVTSVRMDINPVHISVIPIKNK